MKKKDTISFHFHLQDLAAQVGSGKMDITCAKNITLSKLTSELEPGMVNNILGMIELHADVLSNSLIPMLELSLIAADALEKAGDTNGSGEIERNAAQRFFNIGRSLYLNAMWEAAMDFFLKAKAIFVKHDLPVDEATCKFNCAKVMRKLGNCKKALLLDEEAKKVYLEKGLEVNAAECDLDSANAWFELGQYLKAIPLYEDAKKIFLKHSVDIEAAKCDLNLANNLCMLGHQRKAVDIYEHVSTIFTNYGLEVETAKCRLNLANAFADLGKHQEALVIYEEAKDVFVRHGVKSEVQRCDKNTLITLRELKETGDYSKLH